MVSDMGRGSPTGRRPEFPPRQLRPGRGPDPPPGPPRRAGRPAHPGPDRGPVRLRERFRLFVHAVPRLRRSDRAERSPPSPATAGSKLATLLGGPVEFTDGQDLEARW